MNNTSVLVAIGTATIFGNCRIYVVLKFLLLNFDVPRLREGPSRLRFGTQLDRRDTEPLQVLTIGVLLELFWYMM